jgi:hypothetical protein
VHGISHHPHGGWGCSWCSGDERLCNGLDFSFGKDRGRWGRLED